MFITGINFVGGSGAVVNTPTPEADFDYVQVQGMMLDNIFIQNDDDKEEVLPLPVALPSDWDNDVVLWASFETGTTNAGNVDWSLLSVDTLLLKVRPHGEFGWKTIYVGRVDKIEDFKINLNYYLCESGREYDFAVVNALQRQEYTYSVVTEKSDFNKMFVIEPDIVYGTLITDMFCDTTRNIPSANVELLNSKYPIFVRNGKANYDTGTCTGEFIPLTCPEIMDIYSMEDYYRTSYQREFMDFLTDSKPKILKLGDGRIWAIQVMPSPTDSANNYYKSRQISFDWVEIGDTTSEEDMYYLGFSDVPEEYWK